MTEFDYFCVMEMDEIKKSFNHIVEILNIPMNS